MHTAKVERNMQAIHNLVEECVQDALLGEVYTTPKPGLVDLMDTGAHSDMDYHTFERSAQAIAPYLSQMFDMGMECSQLPEQLFEEIRPVGMRAEQAMFAATDGVNTHKGILFTMGILCASAGYCLQHEGTIHVDTILSTSREMTEQCLCRELQQMKERKPYTHGEILYRTYGEEGIRGQARRGFPIIRQVAYPVMKQLSAAMRYPVRRYKQNAVNLHVLLAVMGELTDTNVLSRSNPRQAAWLRNEARHILQLGGVQTTEGWNELLRFNEQCIRRNISPGGAADILAATLFLFLLEQRMGSYRALSGSDRCRQKRAHAAALDDRK